MWDVETGEERFSSVGGGQIMTFSPDGERIATVSDGGTVRVWDAEIGEELITLKGQAAWPRCIAFSPDGHRLATSGQRTPVTIYDATPLPDQP